MEIAGKCSGDVFCVTLGHLGLGGHQLLPALSGVACSHRKPTHCASPPPTVHLGSRSDLAVAPLCVPSKFDFRLLRLAGHRLVVLYLAHIGQFGRRVFGVLHHHKDAFTARRTQRSPEHALLLGHVRRVGPRKRVSTCVPLLGGSVLSVFRTAIISRASGTFATNSTAPGCSPHFPHLHKPGHSWGFARPPWQSSSSLARESVRAHALT